MATPFTRYLSHTIQEDALNFQKIAMLSGPRQCGKTTLAVGLLESTENYFTWDDPRFRRAWIRSPDEAISTRTSGPVLLDEIHKDRRWKSQLKGLYDVRGMSVPLIVTGSARLDIYRKGGDSLLGRYIPYRLHPLTVGEAEFPPKPEEVLESNRAARFPWSDLLRLGGFPEPFLQGSEGRAQRWSRLRLERLVTEDSRDFRAISDLNALRILADLLPERVSSLFSINSLKEDVGKAFATVREWMIVFEALYHCFFIRPYSRKLNRALRAEPKIYLFDLLQIPPDRNAARLENLTALHLLKACQFWTDAAMGSFELRFVRDKEKREVDFLIERNRKPWILIECKSRDHSPDSNLIHFTKLLNPDFSFQLVDVRGFDKMYPEHQIRVMDYEKFFSTWV